MAEPRVAFSSLMQSLEKILRPIDAPTMERVRALGIDFDKLLPAYPVETWYGGIELAMSRFDSSLTPEQKQNHFGVRLVEVYGDTLVGKAMYAMMRLIGPERSIQRATRSFRTATNFLYTGASADALVAALDPQWPGPLPHTVLIAPGGQILWRHNGAVDAETLKDEVLKHMGAFYLPEAKR